MKNASENSDDIIKLNVGGTLFQTTRSTLTKFDGFFKTMLETGVPVTKDHSGAIFIDGDPKHFRLILNYMRDGSVNLPGSRADIQEIQTEAQYYLLDGLVKLCNTQKAVTKETKNHCLETHKEIINAVMNSTKKAVILIAYETDRGIRNVMNILEASNFLVKCSEDFDVYFYPCESTDLMESRVYNKSTGRCSYVSPYGLDEFLMSHYGVE